MYCRIYLSKINGQFYIGIFGDNHKLMFKSQSFVTMFHAKKAVMRMIDKMTIIEFNPKPKDYLFRDDK
jgi:hypothetical protein